MDHFTPPALTQLATAGGALTLSVLLYKYLSKPRHSLPLPPGPPGLPLLGNLLDLPNKQEWRVYARWGELYGDVVHVDALGQPIIILNSLAAASELLDRRSATYSDRPQTAMMRLMNWDWILGNVAYGEQWRLERRLLHEQMHVNVVAQWQGVELRATRAFLQSLLDDPIDAPGDVSRRIGNLFGAIVMEVAYGVRTPLEGSHFTRIAQEAMEMLSKAFLPGAFLVDAFPALRYVPKWVPGAGFQRFAEASRERTMEMLDRPFEMVKGQMAAGTARKCMTTQLYDSIPEAELTPSVERAIKHSAGHVYGAGSDTTISTVSCLFLALARDPSILAKAHAELDHVVGAHRLPDFTHWPELPYVTAITRELLRWRPVLPAGVPHKSTADDVYNGYFIPAGSVIVPNHWSMLHNPEDYPEPDAFKPERFLRASAAGGVELDPAVRDPRDIAFGFGRRICAGMHFAEQSLFIITANVLAAFDIAAPVDAQGGPVYPEVEMTSGLLSHPVPFRCVVKPRSKLHEEVVRMPLPDSGL